MAGVDAACYFEGGPIVYAWPQVEQFKQRWALRMPQGLSYYVGPRAFGEQAGRLVWTDVPALPAGRNAYLFIPEPGGGRMLALGGN